MWPPMWSIAALASYNDMQDYCRLEEHKPSSRTSTIAMVDGGVIASRFEEEAVSRRRI
jgi:hypothetical protein